MNRREFGRLVTGALTVMPFVRHAKPQPDVLVSSPTLITPTRGRWVMGYEGDGQSEQTLTLRIDRPVKWVMVRPIR